MRRVVVGLLLTAAAGFSIPAPAAVAAEVCPGLSCGTEQIASTALTTYLDVAAGYWHARPRCPDGLTLTRFDGGDPQYVSARSEGCHIWIDNSVQLDPFYGYYCQMLVHEFGHLLGHDHDDRGNAVMRLQDEYRHLVPGCAPAGTAMSVDQALGAVTTWIGSRWTIGCEPDAFGASNCVARRRAGRWRYRREYVVWLDQARVEVATVGASRVRATSRRRSPGTSRPRRRR